MYNIIDTDTAFLGLIKHRPCRSSRIEHVGRAEIISRAGAACLDKVGGSLYVYNNIFCN